MSEGSPTDTMGEGPGSALFALTLFLLPWVGVGSVAALFHRDLGAGVQPALLSGALLILVVFWRPPRSLDVDGERVLAALLWTLLGSAAVWGLDDLGLAGEQPWSKAIKQCIQLVYFVALACTPALVLRKGGTTPATLVRWERALSAGLLLSTAIGLYLAAGFYFRLPLLEPLRGLLSSNPSIASGSDELFLGQDFVGIPRVRSGAAEPLYFGSYLLFALPICALGYARARRAGRIWRGGTLVLGVACLLLTFSRGVYLALAAQLVLLVLGSAKGILPRPRRATVLWVGVWALVGVGALTTLLTRSAPWELPVLLWRRMAQSLVSQDLSNLTRLDSWEAAWRIYLAHPLAGVGWGGFGFWFFRSGIADPGAAIFGWPVTNSMPLLFLAETGSVGALLWLLCLETPLSALKVLRVSGRPGGSMVPARFVLATCVVGMLFQILTFSQWNLPHLWICVGASGALARVGMLGDGHA